MELNIPSRVSGDTHGGFINFDETISFWRWRQVPFWDIVENVFFEDVLYLSKYWVFKVSLGKWGVYFSGVMVTINKNNSYFIYLIFYNWVIDSCYIYKMVWQVRLMLVLAPAACIMSGIALSEAFDVCTRSIKYYISSLSDSLLTDVSIEIWL